jgi:ring-1,2-phenylacetyl-CoA epoxidase subunit PaaE
MMRRGTQGNSSERITVEVWLTGERHDLQLEKDETIFGAALRAGLALPFSCLGGYCGECSATLEAGDVELRVNKSLSEKQLALGLILTCQAVPKGVGCRVRFAE